MPHASTHAPPAIPAASTHPQPHSKPAIQHTPHTNTTHSHRCSHAVPTATARCELHRKSTAACAPCPSTTTDQQSHGGHGIPAASAHSEFHRKLTAAHTPHATAAVRCCRAGHAALALPHPSPECCCVNALVSSSYCHRGQPAGAGLPAAICSVILHPCHTAIPHPCCRATERSSPLQSNNPTSPSVQPGASTAQHGTEVTGAARAVARRAESPWQA